MLEQLDGQITANDSVANSRPLVSQEEMSSFQNSAASRAPVEEPSFLEFTNPFAQAGELSMNTEIDPRVADARRRLDRIERGF